MKQYEAIVRNSEGEEKVFEIVEAKDRQEARELVLKRWSPPYWRLHQYQWFIKELREGIRNEQENL